MALADYLFRCFSEKLPFEATRCQKEMFRGLADFVTGALDSDVFVVNGYAGTGKTSAVAAVVSVLSAHGMPFRLMAPTGRAAKVLARYTSCSALTVHKQIYRQASLSGVSGRFTLSPNKDRNTLYIVDEASLIGIDSQGPAVFGSGNLLEDLLAYVRSGTDNRLLLIGDGAQLPPVGLEMSPALDMDYVRMLGGGPFCELTSVVRQQEESAILTNATMLRELIAAEDPYGLSFIAREGSEVEAISGGELIERLTDAYGRYGSDETVVLCRSNKRANRYNAGIRAMVNFSEERLVRGERLMIVKNCYQFQDEAASSSDKEEGPALDFIANGDMAVLRRISRYEQRYGLEFATAELALPDYGDLEIRAKVLLDTLESESASLGQEGQQMLFEGLNEDYADLGTKAKRMKAIREDPYYNALQLKYAYAITGHKSQGGQWRCVFIDNVLWNEPGLDELKWLYTAVTRGVEKVYLVNFPDEFVER